MKHGFEENTLQHDCFSLKRKVVKQIIQRWVLEGKTSMLNWVSVATCSLQATIIIKAFGIAGLRVYGFRLSDFGLDFHLQVVPDVMPLFHLRLKCK